MHLLKTNKFFYYVNGYSRLLYQPAEAGKRIEKLKKGLTDKQLEKIQDRVDYYCKITEPVYASFHSVVEDLRIPQKPKTYYFDTYQYARFFDKKQPVNYVFGDVIHVPEQPSIVKSRPVSDDNQNSVLLKLNKARHFVWVKNDKSFESKTDKMIGRCRIYQKHRIDFYEKHFDNPYCDLGQVNKKDTATPQWVKPKISVKDHLDYKFILSLQGNDIATNLKWIMSSNSIAVMTKPTVESWFMEGKLTGGKHYIEINPDYSDLNKQLAYYTEHPDECLGIIRNAHIHCRQFFSREEEELCNLLVLKKYFERVLP